MRTVFASPETDVMMSSGHGEPTGRADILAGACLNSTQHGSPETWMQTNAHLWQHVSDLQMAAVTALTHHINHGVEYVNGKKI